MIQLQNGVITYPFSSAVDKRLAYTLFEVHCTVLLMPEPIKQITSFYFSTPLCPWEAKLTIKDLCVRRILRKFSNLKSEFSKLDVHKNLNFN